MDSKGEVKIYQTLDGQTAIDVRLENETVWLNQDQIAVLFDKSKSTINEHINHVFKEGELEKEEVVRKFRITTQHGAMAGKTQEHDVMFYNLDVIISVGYRVKSKRGTQRIAAMLFLWFMNNNGILYNPDGSKRIGDNTLVALTLMIAESRTEEKDTMVKVVVNLINKKNV